MASKYLHNIAGVEKTYLGIPIPDNGFYQIPDSMLIKFQNDASVIADIISNLIRLSSDGLTDYSSINISNLNFLKNDHREVDSEGRQIIRTAAGSKGWSYLAHPIEFETSKIGSLYEKDHTNTSRGISSVKFYDADDIEVTEVINESSIVKTVVLVKPPYDYELIAGMLQQIESPLTDVRVWVIGGIIELGGAYVKEFAGGLNMRYYASNESLKTDGRASKYMRKDILGVPYQANQIQLITRHEAGVKHKLKLILEYFRA